MIPLQFNGNAAPILIIDDPLQLELNQLFDPMDYVTAYDEEDGDITEWIQLKENTIDLTQIGMYRLTFEVTDSYGSTTSKTVTVQVGPRIAPETGLSSILLPLGALSIGTGICLKRRKKIKLANASFIFLTLIVSDKNKDLVPNPHIRLLHPRWLHHENNTRDNSCTH